MRLVVLFLLLTLFFSQISSSSITISQNSQEEEEEESYENSASDVSYNNYEEEQIETSDNAAFQETKPSSKIASAFKLFSGVSQKISNAISKALPTTAKPAFTPKKKKETNFTTYKTTPSPQKKEKSEDSSKGEEKKKPTKIDESNCPEVSEIAKRRQSIFSHLLKRWRKGVETQQPWSNWSRKIIKCTLGPQLYKAMGPESKISLSENIKAILKRELKVRQKQLANEEREKNPCHPFLAERGKLKALLRFRASMVLARKPVVYLYPPVDPRGEIKPLQVNVSVQLRDGQFTTVYPAFHPVSKQWEVFVKGDSEIQEIHSSKKFAYLFWEAKRASPHSSSLPSELVSSEGDNLEKYLEKRLTSLGLNERERNDFIVYWLPELQRSPQNLISFHTEEYEDWAKLNISPSPKTVIRVFMTFSPVKKRFEVNAANIPSTSISFPSNPPARNGFTVVEWGGARVPLKVFSRLVENKKK